MRIAKRYAIIAATGVILLGLAEMGERYSVPGVYSFIPAAHAIVGRPLTPVSVAGVARRSVRRDIYR
jgi:hypothetical protein